MRRSTGTTVLAILTAGLFAVGTMPAAAGGGSGSDGFGSHDTTRSLAAQPRTQHSPGYGHYPWKPKTVAEHLAGPLTFGVAGRGVLYVGQSFSGALTKIKHGAAPVDLVSKPGTDVAAVSVKGKAVTWAESVFDPATFTVQSAVLNRWTKRGGTVQLADTLAYEKANNPDSVNTYGLVGASPECIALLPPDFAPYTGGIDSHPYGSAIGRLGTYVADAGSNSLLKVDLRGRVSTVAVLPGKHLTVTAELAAAFGLDPCVVGHDYVFEPVPTDVEIGPDGKLYVTSLPGGPEDGSTGALGSVYRVNPKTGAVKLVATGFAGATGLAISPKGTIYVAELFGGQVSKIRHGEIKPVISLTEPAAVEWSNGRLYVSTDVFTDGKIVKVRVH